MKGVECVSTMPQDVSTACHAEGRFTLALFTQPLHSSDLTFRSLVCTSCCHRRI